MCRPGTPDAAPKQSTVVLTCYFASVINLGRGVPTGRSKPRSHFRPSIREAASGSNAENGRTAGPNGRRW